MQPAYIFIGTFPDAKMPTATVSNKNGRILGMYGYDWILDHITILGEASVGQGFRCYSGLLDTTSVEVFFATTHTTVVMLIETLRLKRCWIGDISPFQFTTLGRIQTILSTNGLSPKTVVSEQAGYSTYIVAITYFATKDWNPVIDREFLTAWLRAS